MDIFPATRIPSSGPPVDGRGTTGRTVDLQDAKPAKAGSDFPAPGAQVGGTVGVEFARHASGVQEVKFYDKRTGEVIDSTPCEKVLDAVTALIALVRKLA